MIMKNDIMDHETSFPTWNAPKKTHTFKPSFHVFKKGIAYQTRATATVALAFGDSWDLAPAAIGDLGFMVVEEPGR